MPIDKMKILSAKEKAQGNLTYTLADLVNGLSPTPPEPNPTPAGLNPPSDEEAAESVAARKSAVDGYYRPTLLKAAKYLKVRAAELQELAVLCENEAQDHPPLPVP